MDKLQVESINVQKSIRGVEEKIGEVEGSMKYLQEDVEDFGKDYDELERVVENLDNNQRKNNLKVRGLKEGTEGQDLKGYLTEVFAIWVGSDIETDISITSAFRIGPLRKVANYPRDILVQLPYWETKARILECYWQHPDKTIEDSNISVFPDLLAITLWKRRLIRFLTVVLQDQEITYKWGFTFKLLVTYKSRTYIIRTEQEARNFHDKLSELLNQHAEEGEWRTQSAIKRVTSELVGQT